MRTIQAAFRHPIALPESIEELARGELSVDAGKTSELQVQLRPESGPPLTPNALEGLERYLRLASSLELEETFGPAIAAREKLVEAEYNLEGLEPWSKRISALRTAGNLGLQLLAATLCGAGVFWLTFGLLKLNEGRREAQHWPSGSKAFGFLIGALELRGFMNLLGSFFPSDAGEERRVAEKDRTEANGDLADALLATHAKLLVIARRWDPASAGVSSLGHPSHP